MADSIPYLVRTQLHESIFFPHNPSKNTDSGPTSPPSPTTSTGSSTIFVGLFATESLFRQICILVKLQFFLLQRLCGALNKAVDWARICKLLRSPGIDRFLCSLLSRFLGIDSWAPKKFINSSSVTRWPYLWLDEGVKMVVPTMFPANDFIQL